MLKILLGLAARHALTGLAGGLAASGYITGDQGKDLMAGLIALGAVLWSVVQKRHLFGLA